MPKPRKKNPTELTFTSGRVLVGSCLDRLKELPDATIDSIVTDPPYELGFMGKSWDASGIAYQVELWRECLRVLKPGGHLLAFGGTRTYHRMAVAIEDAGFEVRDSIHWIYGSGFPKSLDVSKAIDKQRHDREDIYRVTAWVREARDAAGITNKDIDAAFGTNGMAGHWTSSKSQPAVPTLDQVPVLLDVLGVNADDVPEDIRRLLWDLNGRKGQPGENWAKREVVGTRTVNGPQGTAGGYANGIASIAGHDITERRELDITAPATDAAKQWSGWGTALKPAHEPIVVARKPLAGTVAANVLEHGTGALNIDGCRVGTDPMIRKAGPGGIPSGAGNYVGNTKQRPHLEHSEATGRWPSNIVFTHAADCRLLPAGGTETVRDTASLPDIRNGKMHASADRGTVEREVAAYKDTPAVWACVPGCPVAALDEQSGRVGAAAPASGPTYSGPSKSGSMAGAFNGNGDRPPAFHGDQGGASRFFTVTEWSDLDAPFRYVAKPGKKERNAGLDGLPEKGAFDGPDGQLGRKIGSKSGPRQNFHPTVKPVALMRWLVRLVTPPDGTILDPFLGSGTTAVAAIAEGFQWVGCEMTADYLPIIEGRVKHAEKQKASEPPTLFPA